jgi:uncharacterized protein with HEPN domain
MERYAARGPGAFQRDELVQVWIVHYLLIIGAAAARLGRDFHDSHREVPWARIVAMRNILVHQDFGVDLNAVWSTVKGDLPTFKQAIETLLRMLEGGSRDRQWFRRAHDRGAAGLLHKQLSGSRACSSVGRATDSESAGPRFES